MSNFDLSGITRSLKRIGKTNAQIATLKGRALTDLRRRLKVQAAQIIHEPINRSRAKVSAQVRVSAGSNYVAVTAGGKRPPLKEFGGRWAGRKSPGATAQIYRDGSRQTFQGAFILGRKGQIVTRVTRGSGRVPRGPVRLLTGPSPADVLRFTGTHSAYERLLRIGGQILAAESARLFAVAAR